VALVGAIRAPEGSVGATVLRNLLAGGFKGAIYPVNPKYGSIGRPARPGPSVARPARRRPTLAIICTPPATDSCHRQGARRARHPRRHRA
jgi:acetyltransferase